MNATDATIVERTPEHLARRASARSMAYTRIALRGSLLAPSP